MEPALGDLPGWEDMEDTSKAITVKESINKFLLDLNWLWINTKKYSLIRYTGCPVKHEPPSISLISQLQKYEEVHNLAFSKCPFNSDFKNVMIFLESHWKIS